MSRFSLRRRPRISYYEPEEPSVDEYIFCEQCADFVYEYCSIHGPLLVVPDNKVPANPNVPSFVPRAALTIPNVFLHLAPSIIPGAGLGVFTTLTLPRDVRFGPYKGEKTTEINSMYCWQIYDNNNKPSHVIDGADADRSNWMRYVNCARHWHEQNLVAFQYQGQLYYRTIKIIPRFTELMVFYGSEFANSLQVDLRKYNVPSGYPRKFGAPILKKPKLDSPRDKNDTQSNIKQCLNLTDNKPDISVAQNIGINDFKAKVEDQNNNLQETYTEKFICNECNQGFDKKDSIIIHLKSKHVKDLYFRCNKCQYYTVTQESLDRHSKLHDEARQYLCKTCDYRFKQWSTLKRHEKICCRKSSGTETQTEQPYPCSECGKRYSDQRHLARHKRIHTGEKPYPCTECGKRFSQINSLAIHKRIHTGEKPYPCTECGKRFSQINSLAIHKRIHTGEKPYPCTECGKRFSQINGLAKHKRIHTGEKPYPCTECGKRFSQINSLAKHKRIHTGEKPYPCTECGKRFSDKTNLASHKRIHTGEKPYSCSKCNQLFRQRSSLNRHMRLMHKICHGDINKININ